MNTLRNIEGKQFGRLTAIQIHHRVNCTTYWLCNCICGGTKITPIYQLSKGRVTHCGCNKRKEDIEPAQAIRVGVLERLRYLLLRYTGF
jgi:hypothetical protein